MTSNPSRLPMPQRRRLALAVFASLSGSAALLRAQTSSGAMRRAGVLSPSTRAKNEITLKPFFDQMRQLGWVEGQNISYDRVGADDQMATLPRIAAELAARRPEVILAAPTPAAVAAKQATQTIPIVFAAVSDPFWASGWYRALRVRSATSPESATSSIRSLPRGSNC